MSQAVLDAPHLVCWLSLRPAGAAEQQEVGVAWSEPDFHFLEHRILRGPGGLPPPAQALPLAAFGAGHAAPAVPCWRLVLCSHQSVQLRLDRLWKVSLTQGCRLAQALLRSRANASQK